MGEVAGLGLSSDQQAALSREVRAIQAGPGSGKTRVLVTRYITQGSATSRGVALLSFTNAAVSEARRRCAGYPNLLRAPHFVGTIDAFLHRYIVTPAETRRIGQVPSYHLSWDEVPNTTIKVNGVRGTGIPLSAFRLRSDATVSLGPIPDFRARGYYSLVNRAGRVPELLDRAGRFISSLNSRGIYDSGMARVKAYQLLSGPHGEQILDRLATRFAEILVDEAQDCDAAEFGVLRLLQDRGVAVVAVADPDQAIFEFRGSDPSLFTSFAAEQDSAARIRLTTNYRSTTEICKVITAFRGAGTGPTVAHSVEPCSPVYVIAGNPEAQGAEFRQLLANQRIPTSEAVVVAHAARTATAVTGGQPRARKAGAKGDRLAAACARLQTSSDPAERLTALTDIENLILGLLDWPTELVHAGRDRKLERLELPRTWLRRAAGSLFRSLQAATSADEFGKLARDGIAAILQPLDLPALDLGNNLRRPTEAVWKEAEIAVARPVELKASTIHSAKGTEATAVLVALPANLRSNNGRTVLDDLEDGTDTEARRVLYVGASRAIRLLAFGAGLHAERLTAILHRGGVTVERLRE